MTLKKVGFFTRSVISDQHLTGLIANTSFFILFDDHGSNWGRDDYHLVIMGFPHSPIAPLFDHGMIRPSLAIL